MLFNIAEIDAEKLNLNRGELDIFMIKHFQEVHDVISDEVFSWLINPLPIYAGKQTDELKERVRAHTEKYLEQKEPSIKIVQLVKREFHDFLCTASKYYKNERLALGGNINTLITGLSAAIASALGGLAIGVITTLVTAFILTIGKMGKRIACEYLKPNPD